MQYFLNSIALILPNSSEEHGSQHMTVKASIFLNPEKPKKVGRSTPLPQTFQRRNALMQPGRNEWRPYTFLYRLFFQLCL